MNLSERLRSMRSRGDDPAPAAVRLPTEASSLHIDADGRIVIDLREPASDDPQVTTTDLTCSNCHAVLRVERLDTVANRAELACPDCGFRFSRRVTPRVG